MRISVGMLTCVVVVMSCGMGHAAEGGAACGLPAVVPAPQAMTWTEADTPAWLDLKAVKGIVVSPECSEAAGGVELLQARLRELHLDEAVVPKIDSAAHPAAEPGFIHLGVTPNPELESRFPAALKDASQHGDEAYRLLVDKDAVFILGNSLAGLHRGLMTLRQLVDERGRIARVAVADWPDLPMRGTYMAGSAGLKERIEQCATLKLNLMLFECSDFFDFEDPAKRARWEEAFALCRKHFIEPVPELQSFGWGQFVLAAHPEAAEGLPIDRRRFEVKDGLVQSPDPPLAPAATIANPGFDGEAGKPIAGWSADGQLEGLSADPGAPRAGRASLRIVRTEKGTTRVWQAVAIQPKDHYRLTGFLKATGIKSGQAYMEIYGLKPDGSLGEWLGRGEGALHDQDWKQDAVAFDSGDYDRAQIYVRLQDGQGTAWFDDIALTGAPGLNPLSNVVLTASTLPIIQDETGAVTYEGGRDYRIAPAAPLKFPFEVGPPLRIEIPTGSRIKDGSAVLITYDQVPPGSMTCCPSEPLYQKFMNNAMHQVIGALKPKYLHVGHDEPRVLNRDHRCTARKLSNSALFADDVQRMRTYARELTPEIRLMMWSDAVNPYHNGPMLSMNDAAPLLPKDVIQCLWWYDYPDKASRIENSLDYFLKQGVDVTGSPWFNPRNVQQWAEALHQHRKTDSHVLGEIYTSWSDTSEDPWQALTTAAKCSWNKNAPPQIEP